jgi:YkoY family integral membrane protein
MIDNLIEYPFDIGLSTPILLLVLVALESVLSADNAIALAAIAQGLKDEKLRRQALNLGLVVAYFFRMTLILAATWVAQYWQFELLGAGYLLWLVFQYFTSDDDSEGNHHGAEFQSLWQAIPVIAFTDLAFSLDSVTTAIAVSKETWLVVTGATIGIVVLRFMAGLFVRWLEEYTHLEDAGYITVALVGFKLLVRALAPDINIPEELTIVAVAIIFIWGFSKRKEMPEK